MCDRIGLDRAITQATFAERECIARLTNKSRRAVEIGVCKVVANGTIAGARPSHHVHYALTPVLSGRTGACWVKSTEAQESRSHVPRYRIEVTEEDPCSAAKRFHGTFDIVFVDGNHSWDDVVRNSPNRSNRLEQGRIIARHDTHVRLNKPIIANLGSHAFYVELIEHDPRYAVDEQVDSLGVLGRAEQNSNQIGTS